MKNFANRSQLCRRTLRKGIGIMFFLMAVALVPTSAAYAQCSITFGRGGASTTFTGSTTNAGGPWDFIRSTSGMCTFEVFNQTNFQGQWRLYGTGINERIRIGADGAQDSNGWRARSVRITQRNESSCQIALGDAGITQTFFGPVDLSGISGWAFIRSTNGRCVFQVYNGNNLSEPSVTYGSNINARIRAGATGGQDNGGWRIRSLSIRNASAGTCSITLGDNDKSQTFFGPDRVSNISDWSFIRASTGGCRVIVFDGKNFDGRQAPYEQAIGPQIRVGFRIGSLIIQPTRIQPPLN